MYLIFEPKRDLEMNPIIQYVPLVPFILLYKMFLTLKEMDEKLRSDRSNESYRTILSFPSFVMLYKMFQTSNRLWNEFVTVIIYI